MVLCNGRPARRSRQTRSLYTPRATPDGYHTRKVWPDPLSLATTHGISFPAGTEMFHFPAYPPHTAVPAHDGRWVPPFGNPRIKALLAAPRGISQPQTSFIGPVCQGIHHTPLQATRTTRCAWPQGSFLANSQTTNHHTKMITKRSKQTLKIEFDSKSTARTRNQRKPRLARVHYPVLKPPRTTTPSGRDQPAIRHDGHRIAPGRSLGWRSGSPKAHPHHSRGTSHDGRTESP